MLNVAVVGCGRWGMNYVRLLHELPQARLVVSCDTDPLRLKMVQERFPLLSVTDSLDEVLSNRWIDAVIVATPASTHYEVAKRVLLAGKHVMVEKPMTTDSAQAEELTFLAEEKKLTLMVGLTFFYNSGLYKTREIMEDPKFGDLYYLHLTRTNFGSVRNDVGVTWDLAAHDLAICEFLLGRQPEWVQANGATVLNHKLEDVVFITLGYLGGVMANIHVSWVCPNKVREVVAVGSGRRVVFDDAHPTERVRIYEKGIASAKEEAESFGQFRLLVRDGDIISPRVEPTEPLRVEVEHFLTCVAEGKTPLTDGNVGLQNVRVLEAIDRSLQQNGIRVPVATLSETETRLPVAA